MNKFSRALVVILVAGVLTVFAAPTYSQQQSSEAVLPEGSFWHYRASQGKWFLSTTRDLVGDYEVILQNGKLKVFTLSANEREEITQPAISEFKGMLCIGHSSWKYLECPIHDGKAWKVSTRVNLGNPPITRDMKIEYLVKGIEEVTTPAGTFRTFRIEGYSQRSMGTLGFVSNNFVHHFNQDCQCIVKFRREAEAGALAGVAAEREIELIKWGTPKKPE